MIGLSSNKKGFLPAAIRFFTKSPFSHTFIFTQDIWGVQSVQEAGLSVQIVPFEKHYKQDNTQSYEIWRIKGYTEAELINAQKRCHEEFSGVQYGFLQLLWFCYRWLAEKVGKDVRHNKNWMSDGVICSELVYWYLVYLGLGDIVKDFNGDTFQPQDVKDIILAHPELFELVEVKS